MEGAIKILDIGIDKPCRQKRYNSIAAGSIPKVPSDLPLPIKSSSFPRNSDRDPSMEDVDPKFEGLLRGMKILLAEDNLVNQKVACQQLKKYGMHVEVVSDGQQCLDALEGHRDDFELILMDVQVCVSFLSKFHPQRMLQ